MSQKAITIQELEIKFEFHLVGEYRGWAFHLDEGNTEVADMIRGQILGVLQSMRLLGLDVEKIQGNALARVQNQAV